MAVTLSPCHLVKTSRMVASGAVFVLDEDRP
jgi:hypothetical protein